MERVSPFFDQPVDQFQTELLVLMEPGMKKGSLHVFVWEVDDLLGVRQLQYLPDSLHVPSLRYVYLAFIASLS